MKRRLRRPFLNVVKMLLVLFLSVLIVTLSIFIYNRLNKPTLPPVIQEEQNTYEFTLIDYEIYLPEEVDFGFVIAEINVNSNIPLQIGLNNLITDEGITLDKTDDFLTALSEKYLKPGHESLNFSITSELNSLNIFVFIPFNKAHSSNLLINSQLTPFNTISIDLGDSTKLGNLNLIEVENTVSTLDKDLDYEFLLIDLFDKTNFYTLAPDGQYLTIDFSSSSVIYGIKLRINNSSQSSYKITNATLKVGNENILLLNPDIMLQGKLNLLKLNLTDTQEGFLFFETLNTFDLFLHPETKLELTFISNETITLEGFIK